MRLLLLCLHGRDHCGKSYRNNACDVNNPYSIVVGSGRHTDARTPFLNDYLIICRLHEHVYVGELTKFNSNTQSCRRKCAFYAHFSQQKFNNNNHRTIFLTQTSGNATRCDPKRSILCVWVLEFSHRTLCARWQD